MYTASLPEFTGQLKDYERSCPWEVIGLMVSSFPAVQLGELYYRNLERNKIFALRESKRATMKHHCICEMNLDQS